MLIQFVQLNMIRMCSLAISIEERGKIKYSKSNVSFS